MIKIGTKWTGVGESFRVIGVVDIEGKTWIHYRKEDTKQEPKEYSCLEESFLERFTPFTNE